MTIGDRIWRPLISLLSSDKREATDAVIARAELMIAALGKADPLFLPSLFWQELAAENVRMLRSAGIANFKRALSQNYFNFPIEGPTDIQMHTLIKAWAAYPDPTPLAVELKGNAILSGPHGTSFLNSPITARSYTLFVGLLWLHATRDDSENLGALIEEPLVGNPVPLVLNGRRISQDLANSLREYRRIRPFLQPTVADPRPVLCEIGSGYGRVGHVALSVQPCRYWIFDIAPALAVAEWYLERTHPAAKVFRWRPFSSWSEVAAEVASADIAIFSIDQIELVPDASVRAFATVSALHEMRPEQIKAFVALMGRKTTAAIYTKNHTTWKNDRDNFFFASTMLGPPIGWQIQFDRPDDVLPVFTEKLFIKKTP